MKYLLFSFLIFSSVGFSQVRVQVDVPGMVCQMCVFGMKKNFSEVVGDKDNDVIVDLEKKTVTVNLKEKITEEEIKRRVNDAGYKAEVITWLE